MRYDWNLSHCWGFAAVLAFTLGVAACGHNHPQAAKSNDPSGAPNFPAIANVAGSTGHKISREAIDRVQPGMSESEVKKLLGTPFSEAGTGSHSVMMQWFDADNQFVQVIFDNGRVAQKSYGGQNQKASTFTQDKLDQVKTGMTEAKVLQLLGPSKADVNVGPTRVLSWETSTQEVTIQFLNGKVASKFVNPK